MRIAFFSDNFYPELSGISDTITITGCELKKRGHDICFVAAHYSAKDYAVANRQAPKSPADDTVEGMPIVRLPSLPLPFSPTGQSRFALPFGGSFNFLKEFKPDLIHTQSPWCVGREARRAAKKFGVPLVGTNHTAVEDFFPLPAIFRRLDARYYNHCEFLTAPYAGLIERMREVGFSKPARSLANPAELSEFTPADAEDKQEHKRALGLDGPVILSVGRLAPEKRVDVVLRGIALLVKEFPTLTFVATGHGAAAPSLKLLAQELGISRHVRFTGFLSRKALTHVYKAADAFAFMSTSDSMGIALMQAYASGIPAVCARARGLPDYTPEGVGFLVEPGDYAAMAAKLKLLLTDEPLRTRMGAAALEFSKHFSPEKIAVEWEQIYSDVLKPKVQSVQ